MNVLVVDDSITNANILKRTLESLGHRVINIVGTGEDAVASFQISRPDLVTMDVVMPDMDGIEATRRIVAHDPRAVIIMVTTHGRMTIVARALAAGARGFVRQPIDQADLIEAISKVHSHRAKIVRGTLTWDRDTLPPARSEPAKPAQAKPAAPVTPAATSAKPGGGDLPKPAIPHKGPQLVPKNPIGTGGRLVPIERPPPRPPAPMARPTHVHRSGGVAYTKRPVADGLITQLRTLIVEDSPITMEVMREILSDLGHIVIGTAATGAEALAAYRALKPDLVTMDIVMPDMDGIEATTQIMTYYPNALIVMVTGQGWEATVVRALSAGASGYVTQPVSRNKLREVIKMVPNYKARFKSGALIWEKRY